MALIDLVDWLDENRRPHTIWYVKRLSANDTLANKTHQAGPYIPKEFLFDVFPSLHKLETENPDIWLELRIDSHADARRVRVVWYNNKLRDGTRDEARITNLGGASSALLDPESTGALTVFSFHREKGEDAHECHVWVCASEIEEDLVEDRIGPVEPGKWRIWSLDKQEKDLFASPETPQTNCWIEPENLPPLWLENFPSALEIIRKTIELRPDYQLSIDNRLIKRRECEFEIFRSVENAIELPNIYSGFKTVDDFLTIAQRILQRRKARSGKSLELHTREILIEENLQEGVDFSHQPESDSGKRPDFLFPSEIAYKDPAFPTSKLRMLATKTTCKDRWRQILREANRVERKHLLTLQEGVSENQFKEMTEANVQLVVPSPLILKYPKSVRPHLLTLETFICEIRLIVTPSRYS